MSVLPNKSVERIQFCEQHLAIFAANAVAIGTTSAAVTDLTTKTTAARAAFNAQKTAQDAAKDATISYKMALAAMTDAVADIIKSIKVKAATAGDSVYALASIPVPATPSPKPAPGQPTDLVVTLTQTGALDMKWACPNPAGTSGTIYNIFRRVGSEGEYTYIGGTGVREFTDESAPGGAPLLMYKIQAVRSTAVGPWATFNVFLGVSDGSAMVESVVNTSPKLAA